MPGPVFGPRDPFMIPKEDPNKHYRWLATDSRRLSLWLRSYGDMPGYVLEQGPTIKDTKEICVGLGLPESYVDELTGRITYGLNVLASIPKEVYVSRVKYRLDEQLEKIQASKDEVHARVEGIPGVTSFEEHPEEMKSMRDFHTREDRPFSGQAGVGKGSQRAKQ